MPLLPGLPIGHGIDIRNQDINNEVPRVRRPRMNQNVITVLIAIIAKKASH
jgi:hypothetical protein